MSQKVIQHQYRIGNILIQEEGDCYRHNKRQWIKKHLTTANFIILFGMSSVQFQVIPRYAKLSAWWLDYEVYIKDLLWKW